MDEQINQVNPQQFPQKQQETATVSVKNNTFQRILLVLFVVVLLIGASFISYEFGLQSGSKTTMMEKTVVTPTVAQPSPTPDPTANWLSFSSTKYGYSVKYPTTLVAQEDNTNYHSVVFKSATDSAALPQFVIAAIPDTFTAKDIAAYNYMSSDFINLFYTMQNGTSTVSGGDTFTKLSEDTVSGQPAITVEVKTSTYKQHRLYVKKGGYFYLFSNFYTTPDELNTFALFLSTIQFTK